MREEEGEEIPPSLSSLPLLLLDVGVAPASSASPAAAGVLTISRPLPPHLAPPTAKATGGPSRMRAKSQMYAGLAAPASSFSVVAAAASERQHRMGLPPKRSRMGSMLWFDIRRVGQSTKKSINQSGTSRT